jgi:hypothetical protein
MAGLGTFETPDNPEFVDETHVPDPPPSPPPAPVPVAAPAPPPANGFRKPTLDFDHAATPEPVVAAAPEPEPEPEAEAVAAILPGEKFIPAADVLIVEETGGEPAPDTQAVIERITAKAEPTRTGGTLFGGRTAIADGRVLVEVGTGAIVAIGLPVVLYFLREMFNDKKKKKGGG